MDEDRLVKRKQKAKRDGNVNQLAQISKDLGDIYFESGHLQDALLEYQEQLRACEALNDKLNCAIAHRMIGEVHASLGDYKEALKHQTLHLEGAREVDNFLEQQRALATIGRTQFCLGGALPEDSAERTAAFAAAKKAYSKSLRLCNLLENTGIQLVEMMTMRARLLLNLGLVLEEQKQPHQAVELIEKAAELCRKHKLDEDLHRTHLALGALHERQGHFGLALKHTDMAIEIGDSAFRAVGRLTKAELLLRLGNWSQAREILIHLYLSKGVQPATARQVERLLRIVVTICRAEEGLEVESGHKARRRLYEKLGDAAVAVRSYEKAIEYYRGMLESAEGEESPEQEGAALVSLVQTLRDADRFEEAIQFARRELEMCGEPSEVCRSALTLADLLHLAHSEKSSVMEMYDLALRNARDSGNRALEVAVLKDARVYLQDTGELDEAAEIARKLESFPDAAIDSVSETESENANIGAEISLEDLSDVEEEMRRREDETSTSSARNPRRQKRGLAVKRNEKGETRLHVACINGNIVEVEKLLAAAHPTNVRDNAGWTPLHEASNHGYVEIAQLLIRAGADINDPGGSLCRGVTPLHDAASCGNFSIMNLLIRERANLQLRTKDGDSVLDCLECWRKRANKLSAADQAEYDEIVSKLAAVLPRTKKKQNSLLDRPGEFEKHLLDNSDDSESQVEKISAGEDYRRTIASLMNRSRSAGSTSNRRGVSTPRKVAPAPLVDSEETLIDDWLEDDLNCTVKEKSSGEKAEDLNPVKRKCSNSTPEGDKSVKRQRLKSDEAHFSDILNESSTDSGNGDVVPVLEKKSVAKAAKKKTTRQMSLLKAGFTRDSVSRTPSRTPSPVITYSAEKAKAKTRRNAERRESCEIVRLRIRIEEKIVNLKMRFPEQQESSVASLVDDVVAKFKNETGCRVWVNLSTMSGETLKRENTLKELKPVDGVVRLKGEIVEIVVPPITERYAKICGSCRIKPRESILRTLRMCDNSSTFRAKRGEVLDKEAIPLLRCLEYQSKLQILQISGVSLYLLIETLSNTLRRLPTLQELHLQGCDMDRYCISVIEALPPQLRVLDLSYNPLGPLSHDNLYQLISHQRQLQTLNLRSCKLAAFRFSDSWTSLVNLDLSFNPVGTAVSSLQRQMLSLNLSNTRKIPKESSIVREIASGSKLALSTLEILELCCCDVRDFEVVEILRLTPNLTKFILSGNCNLTEIALSALLTRKPTLSLVDMGECRKITEIPGNEVYIDNPRVCTLVVSIAEDVRRLWLGLWRGNADIQELPHDLVTYKPIAHGTSKRVLCLVTV